MGQLALEGLGLGLARPDLERLAERTGEAGNLGVRVGGDVMVVIHVPSRHPLRFEQRPGTRVPVHVSAMGKALLAAGEDSAVPDRLPGFTGNSIRTRAALLAELARVREQGYAVNDEERDLGVRTIAAVVRDARDRPVAAVALQAPVVRLADDRIPKLAAEVRSAATRITRRWRVEGPGSAR
jgi:IclR family acetate operon transcriptional repressor